MTLSAKNLSTVAQRCCLHWLLLCDYASLYIDATRIHVAVLHCLPSGSMQAASLPHNIYTNKHSGLPSQELPDVNLDWVSKI